MLYVPRLTCNLVSIAQWIREIFCIVTFANKLCAIQDYTTRSPIGVDEQQQRVYFFNKDLPEKIQANSAISEDLFL